MMQAMPPANSLTLSTSGSEFSQPLPDWARPKFIDLKPSAFEVRPDGVSVFTIKLDGTIELGPKAKPTEAAKEFLEIMGPMLKSYLVCPPIQPKKAEVK